MNNTFDYEKLKLFYIGKETNGQGESVPLLYKNKDLTTHAAIIGMTGSGKTGLGISLLEEAAIDNIPSIIIDPKGDMGNLLLTFPQMRGSDFEPWIDDSEADSSNMSKKEFAQKTASMWESGIKSDFQDNARIQKLKDSAEFTIYTPGSTAGIPVSLLKTFKAPNEKILEDYDLLTSHINSTVASILSLVGVQSDQVSGKEHIFISSIFMNYFSEKKDINIEELISLIVTPPFSKVGVFSVDDFYSSEKRLELAMKINTLIASPSFKNWMEGEPLDISNLLYTKEGKAKVSIFSISYLSDKERMFFVSILLNEMVSWMRRQEGTSSLKAILYMDEIFGYFPPTKNPPSKLPMLTLLKQARSFGVGVVLSTQNPIDLDYKGLSNIGTWFIGRLQTKQDKQRVIDGLSTSNSIDKKALLNQISNLEKRTFIMKNINESELKVFKTRWVLSYLKGPISKNDIKFLMKDRVRKTSSDKKEDGKENLSNKASKPMISTDIEQFYMYSSQSQNYDLQPYLLISSTINYFSTSKNINTQHEYSYKIYLDARDKNINFEEKEPFEERNSSLKAKLNSNYYELPKYLLDLRSFKGLLRDVSDYFYYNNELVLYKEPKLKLVSKQDESLEDFKIRIKDRLNEKYDDALEKLKDKFKREEKRIESKRETLYNRLEREQADLKSKTTDTIISIGASIFGAFFGKSIMNSTNIGRASAGARKVGRLSKEKNDVSIIEDDILDLNEDIEKLKSNLQEDADLLQKEFKTQNIDLEEVYIKPRRKDVINTKVALLWEEV